MLLVLMANCTDNCPCSSQSKLKTKCTTNLEKGYHKEKTIVDRNDSSNVWQIVEYDLDCKLINRKNYLGYQEKKYLLSLEFFEDSKRMGPYIRYNKEGILQEEVISIDSLCVFYMDSLVYCRTMDNDTVSSEWGVPLFIEKNEKNEIYLTAYRFDKEKLNIKLCKTSGQSGAICKSFKLQEKILRMKLDLDSVDLVIVEINRPYLKNNSIYKMGIGRDDLLDFLPPITMD
jgi:hypothetical protein